MTTRIQHILNNPLEIKSSDLLLIEEEIDKYPYFYPFLLLQAKVTFNPEDNYISNNIQKASIYTTNRKILFDYLKYEKRSDLENQINDIKESDIQLTNTEDNTQTVSTEINEIKDIENTPQQNYSNHNHSFTEWLKISSNQKETEPITNNENEKKEEIEEKFKTIEAFLDKNPKIIPAKDYKPTLDLSQNNKENLSHLMTETLAKIYIEQHKYDKAIKAYRILRLKYPEKSGYFADCINEIKELKNK